MLGLAQVEYPIDERLPAQEHLSMEVVPDRSQANTGQNELFLTLNGRLPTR